MVRIMGHLWLWRWFSSDIADYHCLRPASSYKKFYDHFFEKAHACLEVYKRLSRSSRGNPDSTLDELLARVVHLMSGNKHFFPQLFFFESFPKYLEQLKRMWKKLGFVLIDFKVGCFSLLSLFHLSKMYMLVMCSSIPLNIIAKVTLGAKYDSIECEVCVWIV